MQLIEMESRVLGTALSASSNTIYRTPKRQKHYV